MEGQDIARKLADTPAGAIIACQRGVIAEWKKDQAFDSDIDAVMAWNKEHGARFRVYMEQHPDLLDSPNYAAILNTFLQEEETRHSS